MAQPYEWDNKINKDVVIDTNLLLDDSKILYKLYRKYNRLILPITVLQELDKHKFKLNTSFSSREAIRAIIDFKNNYKDKILFDTSEDGQEQNDRKIINTAVKYGAVLATKDMSMSIIAESLGIDVELYDVVLNNIFSPYVYIQNSDLFQFEGAGTFIYGSHYDGDEYYNLLDTFSSVSKRTLSHDSWFFVFINIEQPDVVIYANNPNNKTLTRIDNNPNYRTIDSEGALLKARDPYQVCAIYALKESQHVLITGRWGSGKTLLSTAQALSDTDKKIFVSRAPLGIDSRYNLGFLPGPQPLDAKLLTPTGWTTMGDIEIGDTLIGVDGNATKVLKIYDKGTKPVYVIETSDGKKTRACGDHLWATKTHNEFKHNKDFKLRTTLEIKENLLNPNKGPKYNIVLPNNDVVVYDDNTELPIPPYTMGVLLAEGSFSDSISFTTADDEIVKRVEEELQPYGLYLNKYGIQYNICGNWESNKYPKKVVIMNVKTNQTMEYESTTTCSYAVGENKTTINSRCKRKNTINGHNYRFKKSNRHYANYIKHCLKDLGLLYKKCDSKFIPEMYKYTSIESRVKLVQGLMDGDGSIKKTTGEQTYFTTSIKLVNDLIEVLRSLGENPTFITRDRRGTSGGTINGHTVKNKLISYCVNVPKSDKYEFFYISRKKKYITKPSKKTSIKVISVKKCDKHEQVRCVKIDNETSLYLTDDFIVTHNTKEDKMQDWLAGFMSALYYLYSNTRGQGLGNKGYDYVKDEIFRQKFEPILINSIQGLSLLDNDTLIVDEVQLITVDYISMILSRPSGTGRLILLGDLKQTYSVVKPSESGLLKLLRVLPHKSIAYVELKNSYRSNLLEVADLLQDKTIG